MIRYFKGTTAEWGRPFKVSQNYVEGFVDAAIRRSEKSNNNPNASLVFLDELIAQTGSKDKTFLRDQMLNIFFPARDSSGIGISLIMFHLVRHPRVWQKARDEVLSAPQPFTYETLKTLCYVKAVVNEGLRLLAPASQAQRTALQPCVLPHGGGPSGEESIYVPKGADIWVYWHAIHLDPAVWGPDAHEFRPERWLEGDAKTPQRRGWEYLPFMGGPRICPAQNMMATQYAYIVARFAQEFRVLESADEVEEFEEEYRMTMQSRNGVKVRVGK